MIFTVFGLQKTSTRFIENFIKKNARLAQVHNTFASGHIWKHAFNLQSPHVAAGEHHYKPETYDKLNYIHCIHVHRNPYTWIDSIITRPIDIQKTYPLTKLSRVDDVMHGGFNITHLCELWNNHTKWWLDESKKRSIYRVKFEDIIVSREKTEHILKEMIEHFGVGLKNGGEISFDLLGDHKRNKFLNIIIDIPRDVISYINTQLDKEIMTELGYEFYAIDDTIEPKKPEPKKEEPKPVIVKPKPTKIENTGKFANETSVRKVGHEGVDEFLWVSSDNGAFGNEKDGPLFDWLSGKDDFMFHVKNFDVVVQAGGNCGMYARFYKNYFKHVYTFEPQERNFYCLDQNCKGRGFHKFFGGLGNKIDKMSLTGGSPGNVGTYKISENAGDIQIYTIDSLELKKCDLIHLDVEGFEEKALEGAKKTIEKFSPVVITENARGEGFLTKIMGYKVYKRCKMDTVYYKD